MPRKKALARVSGLCLENAEALRQALEFCRDNGIGAFRINSRILPVKTHPRAGYQVDELPDARAIRARFASCGRFARRHGIRTLFHPDQFIVLSSADPALTARSVDELVYQSEVARWVAADVINIHGGGAYGDKPSALARVEANIRRLPTPVRRRLTLENDDKVYTPADLLPLCRRTGVPMVYDVHHHRCLPDGLTVAEATRRALATWNREPVLHVSSPKAGWRGPRPSLHHDYVNPRDFPREWLELDATVEVEAKAKEAAVLRLLRRIKRTGGRRPATVPPGKAAAQRGPP
jgi:UV DNA damage endonuclease